MTPMPRVLTVLFLFSLLVFAGCSSKKMGEGAYKIGVDSNWYPNDFGAQNSYINGFSEELLLDISEQSGFQFEIIPANWDVLVEGLKEGKYQAILSSLPDYEFNAAYLDFSHNFLDLGPVLVVPEGGHKTDLAKMIGEHIGVVTGDPAVLILEKYEGLIIRQYPAVPELLEAVANGDIEGALIDRIVAGSYVHNLFSGKLKIAGPPLNQMGLHLVVLKGKETRLLSEFNRSLEVLKKKKRLQALLRKWQIGEAA
jgi:polar amino acid transport system substrate-binding protein